MKNSIQALRENLGLTQTTLANRLNIPVKTIRNWEQQLREPSSYMTELVIDAMLRKQLDQHLVDDTNYIPSFLTIKEKVKSVVSHYNIDKVYLYGSYAKGNQTHLSDIDLYMVSDIDDLTYLGLLEDLRNSVNKRVDVLSNKTIKKDSPIEKEVERTGILLYER